MKCPHCGFKIYKTTNDDIVRVFNAEYDVWHPKLDFVNMLADAQSYYVNWTTGDVAE